MPAKRLRMYHIDGPTLQMMMHRMDSGRDASHSTQATCQRFLSGFVACESAVRRYLVARQAGPLPYPPLPGTEAVESESGRRCDA
ncbi:unnamed protein product [Protopolystoma xenopodis]|uniref:Uncharacterized protein n=1 Tax=Protopolystoma xenopodis TaxID=117903 RepID=A0A3S5A411_9PLAT|nr:unnamed protein product [Protopolystoma xenopodis]